MLDLLSAVRGADTAADAAAASPPVLGRGDVELGALPAPTTPTTPPQRARRLRLPRRAPPAAASSGDESSSSDAAQAGPPADEAQRALFAAADEASAGVAAVLEHLQRLRQLHGEELAASRGDEIRALRTRMVDDTGATSLAASRVRAQIEALARPRGDDADSAVERMRAMLSHSLEVRFRDAMRSFAELRAALRSDHEAVLARRYAAVAGRRPSLDELHALEEANTHDAAQALLQRACAGAAEPGLAAQVVEEVAARHDAILDLERSMAQLSQMFLDMATLVDSQGDAIDSIESQVAKSAVYGERGRRAVSSARRHQRAARRKALLVVAGVAALAALVAVAIAVPAALRRA